MEEIKIETVDEILDEMNRLDIRKLELQEREQELYQPLAIVRGELKMIETRLGILKRNYWRTKA